VINHILLITIKPISIGSYIWVAICFLIIGYLLCLLRKSKLFLHEIEIQVFGFKLNIKPNVQDIQVAYKLWVELSTRKLGLPIDKDLDLILDLHRSFYTFFQIARKILSEIPATKASNKNTQQIIRIILIILNDKIRKYLTKWHADYRQWYKRESKQLYKQNLSPAEFQRKYPKYDELMRDLLKLNEEVIDLKKALAKIIGLEEVEK